MNFIDGLKLFKALSRCINWKEAKYKYRGKPKYPYCGRTMLPGQNGWYCVCYEWNRARKEAYRMGVNLYD